MNEEYETLSRLFRALGKAKDILGEDNWREIRLRLAEGFTYTQALKASTELRREELIARLNRPIPFTPKKMRFPIKWLNWKRIKKIFGGKP